MKIETEEAEVQRIINTKIPDSFLFFDGNAETDKTILEKKQREEQEGFQKHIESLDMKINSVKERIQQGDSLFYPNNQREEKGLSRSLPDLVKDVFRNSKTWAVVIGIKDYSQNRNGYASIPYAVRDAQAIRASLMFNWGIPEKRIFELYNENATKKRIEQLLGDELRNHEELREADQLIIYLSGHGETLVTPTGDRGFFIPYDGRKDNLYSTSVMSG